MELTKLARTGLCLSPLGMGTVPIGARMQGPERVELVQKVVDLGINWFDTARAYGDAEAVLGEVLHGIRDNVVIASKSGAKDSTLLREHIDETLRQLRTDYLDIFMFHTGSAVKHEAFAGPGGLLETVENARDAGKIRFLGFSAHSEEIACMAVDVDSFDFAMVPVNFISTQYVEGPFMEKAREREVTVFAMKPFGGGRIKFPELCLKYLKQFPDVIPCLGVDRVEQMEENIRIWEDPNVLSDDDLKKIETIRTELGDHFCRQCGYCVPCPEGVPITMINMMEAWAGLFSPETLASRFKDGVEKSKGCIECDECVERCPYDLPIPEMVKDGIALFRRITTPV